MPKARKTITEIFDEGKELDAAMRRAVRQALAAARRPSRAAPKPKRPVAKLKSQRAAKPRQRRAA
jgi:hypothetical protein